MLGLSFQVCPSDVDESPLPGETPLQTQRRITREKARRAQAKLSEGGAIRSSLAAPVLPIIIACDTTVLLDGEMLNKPADAGEARTMLRRLRGRTHQVQSAIVICQGEREIVDLVSSQVTMRSYGDDEIEAYIATGDPFDKAGSYAAQHATFQPIVQIRGCPLNVVGLALCHLRACLPFLPDPAPVCAAFTSRPCPGLLDDPEHTVTSLRAL